MLAHFARDMGKDIPLARKIDTKHRARQHLRHGAFCNDLSFFRHCAEYIRDRASLKGGALGPAIRSADIRLVPDVSTMRQFVGVPQRS